MVDPQIEFAKINQNDSSAYDELNLSTQPKDTLTQPFNATPDRHKNPTVMSRMFFGEDSKEQEDRLRKGSIYKHLKSWRLVHLIVKTGDNLKQE